MLLSAVIIAKNEESYIEECIKSVSFCDEIVLVDNNSTDKTTEIAKKYKCVIKKIDSSDFAELRNYGLKSAKGEWVFYIDADERVDNVLKKSIERNVSSKDNKFSGFKVRRQNFYLGNNKWPETEKMLRLIKREHFDKWIGALHETPIVAGEVGELDGFLNHYTHKNLSLMLNKTLEWSKVEARLRYDSGHPKMTWWRFPRVMIPTFFDYYFRQRGYRLGAVGLIESIYQAFSIFITYVRLWELQKKDEKNIK